MHIPITVEFVQIFFRMKDKPEYATYSASVVYVMGKQHSCYHLKVCKSIYRNSPLPSHDLCVSCYNTSLCIFIHIHTNTLTVFISCFPLQETDSWEIIEGLRIGQTHIQRPEKHEGFMLKKRKWPLKGWHKRFFVLDNGILKYSKSPVDTQKGKLHGSIDVGLSVMSIKKRARRIDLDTEEHIYHLKVWDLLDLYVHSWKYCGEKQRFFSFRHFKSLGFIFIPFCCGKPSGLPWQLPPSCSNGQSKVAAWLQESEEMDKCAEGDPLHVGIPLSQQVSNESRLSMSESVSEFFDAQEVLLSASSSENEASDDESYISDVSDNISEDNASVTDNVSRQMPNGDLASGAFRNGRRTCLPAPAPDTSNINLWNILKNNIGKDLSKVSMPVELNEPLNTLQHMCEELEYTELLDKAAQTDDPYERMAIVAAFAVSGYSSTYYRAGSKPFNPLLGETYECIREDKGFCFFSEQVSHHPPISACHCESQNFTFWQDVRWKNKFWGKSMEILPIGTVNVMLPSYGDHYEWNKVTACIHNILSGRRWIEHYGEVTIRNTRNTTCICKLTFVKGNYWSSNVNEVQGSVMDQEGKVIHRLFGKWHEGLYCGVPPSAKCIWRPGSMPTDYELYYGFSRFAIELNELCPELKELLPPTDARFRPDQRYLEEGNVQMAAAEKQRIEEQQRNRRKWLEENNIRHQPRFFKERWVSNNTYWELRKDPGFLKLENPELW
uniref:Oxysterol-binding protein n=1 Tax=Cyprinus carpio TaxID=7962 RepID=A0A8C2HSZ2_CYPCA